MNEVTNEELKNALFAIGNDKALKLDGFNTFSSRQFRTLWERSLICEAIKHSFSREGFFLRFL